MDKEKLIELIERNPSINKRTKPNDLQLINRYHIDIFKKPVADLGCHTCVLSAFNKLRVHMGYAPLGHMESKNITKRRLEICNLCPYRVEGGFMGADTCGSFANKLKPNPDLTDDGKVLCGCVLSVKARTPAKWLRKINDWCADNRWDT